MKKGVLLILMISIIMTLSGCFGSGSVPWDFPEELYETPIYYEIEYSEEYEGIESMRLGEIVGKNYYFDGFYIIDGQVGFFYYRNSFDVLYQIEDTDDGYVCSILEDYDIGVHVNISKFEDDLLTSKYETRGEFPYRYTIAVGGNDPFIEFFDKGFPTIDFDYHEPGELYYYSVLFRSSSMYSAPILDETCDLGE